MVVLWGCVRGWCVVVYEVGVRLCYEVGVWLCMRLV